jgi:hypothetical protein
MECVESISKDSGLPGQSLVTPIAFSLAKYRFVIRPTGKMHLPPYKGATLRGGFGYAFKDLVCIKPDRQCEACLIQDRCPYFQIFETPVPKGATMMRKYTRAPHPFVLTPPLDEGTEFTEKDELAFELVLIGRAIDHLPYFIYVFEELGRRGIGRNRSEFSLLRVEAFSCTPSASSVEAQQRPRDFAGCLGGEMTLKPVTIYDGTTKILKNSLPPITFADMQSYSSCESFNGDHPQVTLSFLTPVRIWTHGKLDHELSFTDFMKALLRRIQLLQFFHCIQPTAHGAEETGQLKLSEIRRLLKLSESVETTKTNLRFYDLTRFSTRQRRHTSISGFTGSISVTFPNTKVLADFAPYSSLGVLVHVGKGTSFGLGRYQIIGNSNFSSTDSD